MDDESAGGKARRMLYVKRNRAGLTKASCGVMMKTLAKTPSVRGEPCLAVLICSTCGFALWWVRSYANGVVEGGGEHGPDCLVPLAQAAHKAGGA